MIFFSVKDIEAKITIRKTDINHQKINWLMTRVIKICKETHLSIFFKSTHDLDKAFQEMSIHKYTKERTSTSFTDMPLL